jgi:O-antigen ligase
MKGALIRNGVAPAYLFSCLLLGGSVQGVWGNALLQIGAILIIGWWAVDPHARKMPANARPLAWLLGFGVLVAAVQMLPLPPGFWTGLPGREMVAEGRKLLGLEPEWSRISLAPYETMATLLYLLPPIALFVAVVQAGAKNDALLAVALIAATLLGVLLGLLQVSSGNPTTSPWYLYRISNFGFATGFFANSNHMASLLLVALPFVAALGARAAESVKDGRKRYTIIALAAGGAGVVVIGIALNGSLAGAGLLIPVAVASLLLLTPLGPRSKLLVASVGIVALAGFVILLLSPAGERLAMTGASASLSTRQEILSQSVEMIKAFSPIGSGLGTYPDVYALFEAPDAVTSTYVNHAHNDYVELAVELGVVGVALVTLFLIWWLVAVRRALAAPSASLFAKAGAIGSASVLLHSAVDYPLRTSAIASAFALCLAMLLLSRKSARTAKDLREARHLVIE